MKRFLLLLTLILVLTSCNKESQNENNKVEVEKEEVENFPKEEEVLEEKKIVIDYVKSTDYSTEKMDFPQIVTNSDSKNVNAINDEIKSLFDELASAYDEGISGYKDMLADYSCYITGNILSISIRYLHPYHFYTQYKTYNLYIDTGETYSFKDAFAKSGLIERQVEESIKAYAAADYSKQMQDDGFSSDVVEVHTYEDYQDYLYENYKAKKKANELPFVIMGDNRDLVVFVDTFLIYHDSFAPMKPVALSEYVFETGIYSAGLNQPLSIRYEPSEEEIKKANPKLTYLGVEGEEWTEKFLLSSTTSDLNLKFYTATFDENTFEMVPDQVLEEVTLTKGESILVDIIVPEGMPAYGVEVSKGDMKLRHEFGYNGLFGNPPLEMPIVREPVLDD